MEQESGHDFHDGSLNAGKAPDKQKSCGGLNTYGRARCGTVTRTLVLNGARSSIVRAPLRRGIQRAFARQKARLIESQAITMAGEFHQPLIRLRAVTGLRAVIEGFAARNAPRRVAEGGDKRELLEGFVRLERAAINGDAAATIAADRALHLTIVRTANIDLLQRVWETVANVMEWFRVNNTLNL